MLAALSAAKHGSRAEIVICNNFMNGHMTRGKLHGKRSTRPLWGEMLLPSVQAPADPWPSKEIYTLWLLRKIISEWQMCVAACEQNAKHQRIGFNLDLKRVIWFTGDCVVSLCGLKTIPSHLVGRDKLLLYFCPCTGVYIFKKLIRYSISHEADFLISKWITVYHIC